MKYSIQHTVIGKSFEAERFQILHQNNIVLTLTSGVSQSNTANNGPLATIQTVGNLQRLRFDSLNEPGMWSINMESTEAYNLKVTGELVCSLLYTFLILNVAILLLCCNSVCWFPAGKDIYENRVCLAIFDGITSVKMF